MRTLVNRPFVQQTLEALVRVNSINPDLDPKGPGEREIARVTSSLLEDLGLQVQVVGPYERPSVVGVLPGTGGGRSLMLNGHYDTVGVAGVEDPFAATVRDGRMWGRGAYDMKGGVAACLGAAEALVRGGARLRGDVVVSVVADEEVASLGAQAVVEHVHTDATVVTEPTHLEACIAHKGFSWMEITAVGKAAHGSQYEVGIDANLRLAAALSRLSILRDELATRPPHPLLGRPSMHVGRIEGGEGWSTYAAAATARVERRILPDEDPARVRAEMEAIALGRDAEAEGLSVRFELERPPFEARPDSALQAVLAAVGQDVLGRPLAVRGENPWMDSAFFAAAGSDTIVLGPAGAGAHAAEEWVDLESVFTLTEILRRAAISYCG